MLAIKGMEVAKPVDQAKLPDYSSYKVARELFKQNPRSTACCSTAAGARSPPRKRLEDDTGRPAVSSTAASVVAMHVLGIKVPNQGYGRLLR